MDRFHEMAVFVAVAEEQGFAAAARRLRQSAPSLTRTVAALEERIGTRLLARTTRSLHLTEAGQDYFDDCKQILAALADAEDSAAGPDAEPRGCLRLTASVMFGQTYVAPLCMAWLDLHPLVHIRALFVDRVVAMADEAIDLAIRIGNLPDPTLEARFVGQTRWVVCASPAYLLRHGTPQHPSELTQHRIAMSAAVPTASHWRFVESGESYEQVLAPAVRFNLNQAAIDAALRGFGLTRVLSYQIAPQLAAGTLRIVLPEYELPPLPIQVMTRRSRRGSAKVASFVDFCSARLRSDPIIGVDGVR